MSAEPYFVAIASQRKREEHRRARSYIHSLRKRVDYLIPLQLVVDVDVLPMFRFASFLLRRG